MAVSHAKAGKRHMKTLYVLLMICESSASVCDSNTARAVQQFRAPEGIIVCGVPVTMTIQESAVRPAADEYIKTRCELKDAG